MIPTQNEKAERFRTLHAGPKTFVIPNPWDAGTARMLTALGFPALATTSAGFAFSVGRRDGDGAVTRDETLAHARAIVEATDRPVSADLENGFGADPATVAETIRMAASVGLVGGSVEDATTDPRRPLYAFGHAVERVAAAVAAARALPFPFTLVARAENFLRGKPDLGDTIRRLQAYAAAGADVLYAPALPHLDAVRAVCAAVHPLPVNVLAGGKGSSFTVANLAAAGVRRISVGSALNRAALGAFLRASREILEKGTFTFGDDAAPFAELNGFMADRER
ncbi:MAG TPA: isocitrate lyase/phosphoenolpyruvate mutase family protein [Thermoanaerobaculia bacterium]